MSLKAFIKSKKFILNLVLMVVLLVVLLFITMKFIQLYSRHGETLSTPDFTGLTEREVKIVCKENYLNYQIFDSTYIRNSIPGAVLHQSPEAGYAVKKGRTIYLTIAALTPEKVRVPFVVDVSLREAQNRLEGAGFRLGKVEYRPSEFFNLVLSQYYKDERITGDTLLVKGVEIDLIVGKGLSNEKTQVPFLIGMYLNDAREMLYNAGLNHGALVYDDSFHSNDDSLRAIIWQQSPVAGDNEKIEIGTSVDLWVTTRIEKVGVQKDEDLNEE